MGKSKVYRRAATSVAEYFRRELPSGNIPVLSKMLRRMWVTLRELHRRVLKSKGMNEWQ